MQKLPPYAELNSKKLIIFLRRATTNTRPSLFVSHYSVSPLSLVNPLTALGYKQAFTQYEICGNHRWEGYYSRSTI